MCYFFRRDFKCLYLKKKQQNNTAHRATGKKECVEECEEECEGCSEESFCNSYFWHNKESVCKT